MSNLRPSTLYNVYCGLQLLNGFQSTASSVSSTKVTTKTECCIDISFNNAPSYIYGDVNSLYSFSTSSFDKQSYTYTYTLSFLPLSSSIQVVPTIYDSTGALINSSSITILPSSTIFSPTSGTQQGSFIIYDIGSSVGSYTIKLVVTGDEASTYKESTTPVEIYPPTTGLPAPQIKSAYFSDDGTKVYVKFNIDISNITAQSFPCSDMFEFVSVDTSTCTWINSTTIEISYSSSIIYSTDSYLQIGSNITLTDTYLTAKCRTGAVCSSNGYSIIQTIAVDAPLNNLIPDVVLSLPETISKCDNLSIDATLSTGGGGRSWKDAVWTFIDTTTNSDVDKVSTYLNAYVIGTKLYEVVTLPYLLPPSRYLVTLTLTNFLGYSSQGIAYVVVSSNALLPILTYTSGRSITAYSFNAITIEVSAAASSCASTSKLTFSNAIYLNGINQHISSTGNNPRTLVLSPYTLKAGKTYKVIFNSTNSGVTASSSASLTILKGQVISIISGGTTRLGPLDEVLKLDASPSYDQDNPSSSLSFAWSCMITSFHDYGLSCNSLFGSNSRYQSVVLIPANSMNISLLYTFTVQVKADDNIRFSIATVDVEPKVSGISVFVRTLKNLYNVDNSISLGGIITSRTYSAEASWTVYHSGIQQSVPTLTPLSALLSAAETSSGINFPIAFSAYTFTQGRSYTVRLTAYPSTNPSLSTFASTVITINSPPSGGVVTASPSVGIALSTVFLISGISWVTSPSNYPLQYQFSYKTSSVKPILALGILSSAAHTYSKLPKGPDSLDNHVTLYVSVYDIYLSSSNSSSYVTVRPNNDLNQLNTVLSDYLQTAFDNNDMSAAIQSVSIVSSSANTVNCSLTSPSYCAALNRDICETSSNLCGSCLSGFIGVVGPYNSQCYNSSEVTQTTAVVDSSCSSMLDCIYGECIEGICKISSKICPSSTSDECSNHGSCIYVDTSDNQIDDCLVSNGKCFARCSCDEGYGGSDCSLTSDDLSLRDSLRGSFCSAIYEISNIVDKSGVFLDSVVSAIQSSFNGDEIYSDATKSDCLEAFEYISSMAVDGYLKTSKSSTISSLIRVLSQFINSNVFSSSDSSLVLSSKASTLTDSVNQGILGTMVNGQNPMTLISDFVQVVIESKRTSGYANQYISAPLSAIDETSESSGISSVYIGSDGLSSCYAPSGYAKLAVTQWLRNPFPDSSSVTTPLLKVTSYSQPQSTVRSRALASSYRRQNLSYTPSFYITLQFAQNQNFNFSDDFLVPNRTVFPINTTIPVCQLYDIDSNSYVSCNECDISSYSNTNVTYGCKDPSLLCDITSSNRRLSFDLTGQSYRRSLQTATADDDSTVNDQSKLSNMFGAILQSLVTTLSTNPFGISAQQAVAVVAVAGTIACLVFFGIFYFLRWDRWDHDYIIYLQKDQRAKELKREVRKRRGETMSKTITQTMKKMLSSGSMSASFSKEALKRVGSSTNFSNVFDEVTFPMHLLQKFSPFVLFREALLRHHQYIAPFYGSSLRRRRVIRWLGLMYAFLSNLFIDTLFYETFYPDYGYCNDFILPSSCESKVNAASGQNTCIWTANPSETNGGHCSLRSPPSAFIFVILSTLLIILIAIPIQLMAEYLLYEYAYQLPDFEQFNITISPYFGSSTVAHSQEWISYGPIHKLKLEKQQHFEAYASHLTFDAYADFLSPAEEREIITQNLRMFLNETKVRGYIPWIDGSTEDGFTANLRLKEFMQRLGVNPDGSPMPLTFSQLLLYGRPEKRLDSKIAYARKVSSFLIDEMDGFDATEDQLRNALLFQQFILEQVSFFKRFCISKQLFQFHTTSPRKIDPFLWLAVWTFLILILAFFLYWIFAWSAQHSGSSRVLYNWGINFIISLVIDIFFTQVMKVYIVHVIGVTSVRKQVATIYHVLNDAANREADDHDPLRLVQHLSPACRASRNIICKDLGAARILRSINDVDVARCRKGKNEKYGLIFLFIIIPSILALISLLVADKTLDAILPMVLTGFLLANQIALDISIYLLIGFYGFIVLLLLWKLGVIDTAAQQMRRRVISNSKEADQFKQADNDMTIIAMISQGIYVTYQSCFHSKRNQVNQRWKLLNIPYFHQGFSGLYELKTSKKVTSSQRSNMDEYWGDVEDENVVVVEDTTVLDIPTLVSALCRQPPVAPTIAGSLRLFLDKTFDAGKIFANDAKEIYVSKENSELANKELDQGITTNFDELLRRIMMRLQRYYITDELKCNRHTYSVMLLQYYDEEHTLEDYVYAMECEWPNYTPYHFQITSIMKDEITEMFVEWHHNTFVNESYPVNFTEFALWLSDLDDNIRRYLEFTQVNVRYMPIQDRIASPRESPPE